MNNTPLRGIILLIFFSGLVIPPLFFDIGLNNPSVLPLHGAPYSIPQWEQIVLFIAAFIIKPLYMTLALVIAFLLRSYSAGELVALRRGMILFFLGELACALNYLIFRDNSPLFEYWHNYGMICAFALFAFSFMETLDTRILHYSDREKCCVLLPLCGGCYKQSAMRCTLLTLFRYLLPAIAALAAMPLVATVENRFVSGVVLGEKVLFGHPLISQMIEVRFFPALAAFFLLLAFTLLVVKREHGFNSSKILVAAGLGPLVFSLMRFACYWGYAGNPLWADVWEELTEFMFVLFIVKITLMVRAHYRKFPEEP